MNTSIKSSRWRPIAASLLLASLAVRAVVPLGYMPGKIADGEFMVLCPVASAAAISMLPAPAEHTHEHGAASDEIASVSVACPIGSSLFFDAIPGLEYPLFASWQRFAIPRPNAVYWYISSPDQPPVARGPPHA